MYNRFFSAMLNVKKDCIRHLKNNYIVEREFWTEKGDHIKPYTFQNGTLQATVIPLHKENGKLIYEYMHSDNFGNKQVVSSVVHESLVSLVPDGYMEKSIEVIKAYSNNRLGTTYPEVTLIEGNRYRINLWD